VAEKCITITVKPKPQPKFEVESIHVSKTTLTEGEDLYVEAYIKNTGDAGGTATVKLKVDGTIKAQKDVYIPAGAQSYVSFHISGLSVGTHTICAEV